LPAPVGAEHVQLDEGSGQRLQLPRRGGLAGPQANDGVLDPHRLAGPQRDVADDPVALVEQAEDGDPLLHRGDPGHGAGALRSGRRCRTARRLPRLLDPVAAADGKRRDDTQSQDCPHAQSGVHG